VADASPLLASEIRDMHALARKLRKLARVRDEELRALVTMLSVKRRRLLSARSISFCTKISNGSPQNSRISPRLVARYDDRASIFGEWNVGQRPALERIAHLLCEQTVRLEAIGIVGGAMPRIQVDLADAAGHSTVHTSRTIQDLRPLGVLLKNSRAIAVAHWDRLVEIARFDGRYLNMPQGLSKRSSSAQIYHDVRNLHQDLL
jgi:CRP-like cAMP-binding protein